MIPNFGKLCVPQTRWHWHFKRKREKEGTLFEFIFKLQWKISDDTEITPQQLNSRAFYLQMFIAIKD